MSKKYTLKSEVWLYPTEKAAWHFVSVGKKESGEIKKKHGPSARGFGSFPVEVTILKNDHGQVGKTTWKTSIFPDKRSGTFILPLKAKVRKAEGIQDGDRVEFLVEVCL